ncbi:sulfite exporter TauE/SafE family protein [Bacillus sp. ISL-41]|uniref:sulfite exporter TauE/SafE family protein n=1 Tax=Bacillus sp. ISL-41 TaxID=2819127 RepID=UPI001BE708DF|nr:sulfite exporter TauE/SafE family protein [Bacillus sp. ISL-41]MBT2642506.1 sulfite exporter TauE/SafE family protein [Bacillus sp. ISL-41]
MENWILLFMIVLMSSLLQTSTGYGFSLMSTPFLFLIYPVHTAIQINIILSLCLSVFMIFKIRKEIEKPLLIRLIKGSSVGVVLGIPLYLYINVEFLKIVVGVLILIFTVLLILKFTIIQTKKRDLLIGGLSGFLTTSIGIPGPPLLIYFSGEIMEKASFRNTPLSYNLFVYSISLILQLLFGGTSKEIWTSSLFSIPALFMGILLGQYLFSRISQRTLRVTTYLILLFTGGYLIISILVI